MDIIKICGLTKDYGKGKGIFDIDITVRKGEVYGYLGPNGAGKSTTLRHLMGFMRPQSGMASIEGMDPSSDCESRKSSTLPFICKTASSRVIPCSSIKRSPKRANIERSEQATQ